MPTVITPAGGEGVFNGTTEVDVVPAPSASQQHVITFLKCFNRDTVVHDFTIRHSKGATDYDHVIQDLEPGEWVEFDEGDRLVLDATDEILRVLMDAAHTTTAPFWIVTYGIRVAT